MSAPPSHQKSLRQIVLTLFPWLVHAGPHVYRVARVNTGPDAGTVDLEPPPVMLAPEPLPRVSQWAGAGVEATPTVGSEVVIVFLDNNRRKPAVVSYQPLRSGKPSQIEMDASAAVNIGASAAQVNLGAAAAKVLRDGDTITISGPVVAGPSGSVAGTISVSLLGPLQTVVRA